MHKFRRAALWVLTALPTWALAVIPCACLIAMAGAYFWWFYQTALAPGVPVTFEYQGAAGSVRATVDSYRFDLKTKTVHLFGVRVAEAGKPVSVEVDRATVALGPHGYAVDALGAILNLARLKNGSFSVEALAPKSTGPQDEKFFRVNVRDAVIHYLDETKVPVLSEKATIASALVEGIGSRIVATAIPVLESVGQIPLSLWIDGGGGAKTDIAFSNAKIRRVWQHVERWIDPSDARELQDVSFGDLHATGNVSLTFGKRFLISANAHFAAANAGVRHVWANAAMSGSVRVMGTAAHLDAQVSDSSNRARFAGNLDWSNGLQMVGDYDFQGKSKRFLITPVKKALPQWLDFQDASWTGKTFYAGERFALDGLLQARALRLQKESFSRVDSRIRVSDAGVFADIPALKLRGLPVSGAIAWNSKAGVSGYVKGQKLGFDQLASTMGYSGVRGQGSVSAIFGGNAKSPSVDLALQGAATVRMDDDRWLYAGLLDARASLTGNVAKIQRLTLSGPNGAAVVHGEFDTKTQEVNLTVNGGGLAIQAFDERVKGLGFVDAIVEGTLRQPRVTGQSQIFGVQIEDQSIPAISLQFHADREMLFVEQLTALIGTGRILGDGNLRFKDSFVNANLSAENIQISDWLPDYVGGLVSAQNVAVSGHINELSATGDLSASNLVIQGIALVGAKAKFSANHIGASLSDLTVGILGDDNERGEIVGSANIKFEDQAGQFKFDVLKLPVSVLSFSNEEVSLDGTLDGGISGTFANKKLDTVESDWKLLNAKLNGNGVGSGFAEANFSDGTWSGSGQFGLLDRYVQISDIKFNPETKRIEAQADVTNVSLHDTALIFRKQIGKLPESGQRLALSTYGDLSASALISGTTDQLDVALSAMSATGLSVVGRPAGALTATAIRKEKVWTIPSLEWKNENSVLRATGVIAEGGDTKASLDVYNFDLSWLRVLYSTVPPVIGSADFAAIIEGKTEKPTIRGTAQTTNIGYMDESGKTHEIPLAINLDNIRFESDRLFVGGTFNFDGFAGLISGESALSALMPFDAEQGLDTSSDDFKAKLSLIDRDFDDVKDVAPWIDRSVSAGKIGGSLDIAKSQGQFVIDGQILLDAPSLKSNDLNAKLQNLTGSLKFTDSEVIASVASQVNDTGRVTFAASTSLDELFTGGLGLREKLSRSILKGTAKFEGVQIKEGSKKRDILVQSTLDGTLAFAGSLLTPEINGEIGLSGLDIALLGELTTGSQATSPFINPRFNNIHIFATDTAHFRTRGADVALSGSGTINGDLEFPNIRSLFTLKRGTYQLPLSRIRLDEGGTIQFTYEATQFGSGAARLDVDLDGKTRIVASPVAGQFESYDVDIKFRGNLLEDSGLTIVASSDPPGLTQAQVLAAIGQAGLLDEFARGKFREGVGILFGQYLPQLIGRQTAVLAKELKLDYISLEYSPTGAFVVSGAKSLGRNLLLQMTREVAGRIQQIPKYEVKLTYRIPAKNALLEKTRLGYGFDQSNPWKFSLDYGTRLWSFQLSKRTSDGKTWQRVWP